MSPEERAGVLAVGDVEVRWEPSVELPDRDETMVLAEGWAELVSTKSGLFDGDVLVMTSWSAKPGWIEVQGRFVEYRRFAVALHNSRLAPVHPIGVSAVTTAGAGSDRRILVGKRAQSVTQYPGAIELVPSGSIGRDAASESVVDYRRSVVSELEEEAGISPKAVQAVEGRSLCFDPAFGVYDIGCEVVLDPDAGRIGELQGNHEYEWIAFMPEEELLETIARSPAGIVPTSAALLSIISDRRLA